MSIITTQELKSLGVSATSIKRMPSVDCAGPNGSKRFTIDVAARCAGRAETGGMAFRDAADCEEKLAELRAGTLKPYKDPYRRPKGYASWDEGRQVDWAKGRS